MRTSNSRVLERTVPRVAYFEDVQGIARYMEDQLSRRGVLVDLPASIEECELLATRECVEAFILDVDMGEGREREGLDALKRLKEIDPAIFCALLTDHHDNDQVRAMANHLGCDAFLGKSSTDLENIGQVLSVLEAKWPGLAGRMPVDARTDDFDDNDSESSDGQDELQNTPRAVWLDRGTCRTSPRVARPFAEWIFNSRRGKGVCSRSSEVFAHGGRRGPSDQCLVSGNQGRQTRGRFAESRGLY